MKGTAWINTGWKDRVLHHLISQSVQFRLCMQNSIISANLGGFLTVLEYLYFSLRIMDCWNQFVVTDLKLPLQDGNDIRMNLRLLLQRIG